MWKARKTRCGAEAPAFSGAGSPGHAELRESADPVKLEALQKRLRGHDYRIFEILKGRRVREIPDFLNSRKRNFMLASPAPRPCGNCTGSPPESGAYGLRIAP